MILVLASEFDDVARDLVARWPKQSAALLTARDLSTPGYTVHASAFERSTLVVNGQVVPVSSITGALSRLPFVIAQELYTIDDQDKEYVASEMHSFLFYLFHRLPCKVLNRPRDNSLTGNAMSPDKWTAVARMAGLPCSTSRQVFRDYSGTFKIVTVVGDNVCGDSDPVVREYALRLAQTSGLNYGDFVFEEQESRFAFHSVIPLPRSYSQETIELIHDFFTLEL